MRRRAVVLEVAAVAGVTAWLAARVVRSAPSTLWLDDAWLALVTKAGGLGEVLDVGVTAPGFAAVLRAVHELTGTVEGLTYVATAAALAAPAAAYLAARLGLRLGAAGALAAAAVVAAAPVVADHAGRVKPFTVDVVLGTTVLGVAGTVLRRPEAASRWWALGAVSVAAFITSAATASTIAGAYVVAGVVAVGRREHRPAALPVFVTAAVGGAWWAFAVRPAVNEGLRRYWEDFHTLRRAPDAAGALLPAAGGVALAALVVAAALALARADRRPVAALALVPLAVGAAAGAAGLQPLGGGRTDAHLLPAVALLVSVAVAALPRPAAGAAAVVAAAVVAAGSPAPYPAEDLGPLVAAVEERRAPGDVTLVYSSARWAWALETTEPVELVDSDTEANGFDVAARTPGTRILPRLRDDPAAYPAAVARVTGGAATVWLLVSHPGADVDELHAALAGAGFELAEALDRPGAQLTRWVRAATR